MNCSPVVGFVNIIPLSENKGPLNTECFAFTINVVILHIISPLPMKQGDFRFTLCIPYIVSKHTLDVQRKFISFLPIRCDSISPMLKIDKVFVYIYILNGLVADKLVCVSVGMPYRVM